MGNTFGKGQDMPSSGGASHFLLSWDLSLYVTGKQCMPLLWLQPANQWEEMGGIGAGAALLCATPGGLHGESKKQSRWRIEACSAFM